MIFEAIESLGGEHEEVIFINNKDTGLKGIIAVHNTTLGPALGGVRMWNYSSEKEALVDVLRLSRGMTYKAAVAGLNLGGGKAVIMGDPKTQKTESLFRSFGAYVNSLNGLYITAEDVGTTVRDMEYIFMETPYVTGIPETFGGSGNPSPYTAHGVLMGIKACVKEKLGQDSLQGVRVAVQGLGQVGSFLTNYLVEQKALVTVSDIEPEKVKRISKKYDLETKSPDELISTECDVLAPCALGGVINDQSLMELKCSVVAGGANNQLADEVAHSKALKEMGILYAPDFVINAGGLMNVFVELEGYSSKRATTKTTRVYDSIMSVFQRAKQKNVTPLDAAYELAKERIHYIANLRKHHQGRISRSFANLKEMKQRLK